MRSTSTNYFNKCTAVNKLYMAAVVDYSEIDSENDIYLS